MDHAALEDRSPNKISYDSLSQGTIKLGSLACDVGRCWSDEGVQPTNGINARSLHHDARLGLLLTRRSESVRPDFSCLQAAVQGSSLRVAERCDCVKHRQTPCGTSRRSAA